MASGESNTPGINVGKRHEQQNGATLDQGPELVAPAAAGRNYGSNAARLEAMRAKLAADKADAADDDTLAATSGFFGPGASPFQEQFPDGTVELGEGAPLGDGAQLRVAFDGGEVGAWAADELVDAIRVDVARWEAFRASPENGKGSGGSASFDAAQRLKGYLRRASKSMNGELHRWSVTPIADYLAKRLGQRDLQLLAEMARFGIDENTGRQTLGATGRVALFDMLGGRLPRTPVRHQYTAHVETSEVWSAKYVHIAARTMTIAYENDLGWRWYKPLALAGAGGGAGGEVTATVGTDGVDFDLDTNIRQYEWQSSRHSPVLYYWFPDWFEGVYHFTAGGAQAEAGTFAREDAEAAGNMRLLQFYENSYGSELAFEMSAATAVEGEENDGDDEGRDIVEEMESLRELTEPLSQGGTGADGGGGGGAGGAGGGGVGHLELAHASASGGLSMEVGHAGERGRLTGSAPEPEVKGVLLRAQVRFATGEWALDGSQTIDRAVAALVEFQQRHPDAVLRIKVEGNASRQYVAPDRTWNLRVLHALGVDAQLVDPAARAGAIAARYDSLTDDEQAHFSNWVLATNRARSTGELLHKQLLAAGASDAWTFDDPSVAGLDDYQLPDALAELSTYSMGSARSRAIAGAGAPNAEAERNATLWVYYHLPHGA